MRKPEESNFCYYPFMQILLTSEGKYRPCSKHMDHISHEGKILNAETATIEEAWNSDYMQEIRKQFKENKQFPGCSECWRQQKIGLKSMRYDSYQYNVEESQVQDPVSPLRIELNSSNVCNLRCRICYPTASSKWINEANKLYGWEEKIHENLKNENLEIVKSWSANLTELCLFGGEPLLSAENINLLNYLISSGNSKNIDLLFNTNGTVFSAEIVQILSSFKKVRMYFSIDDIGERFEYQRKGAKWCEVVENIRQAYHLSRSEQGANIDFKICTTVSSLNIYYFPEFFEFFGKEFPGLKIFWNLLFDPWELSVQALPNEVKKLIKSRLENQIHPTFKMTQEETNTIADLVKFLEFDIERPFQDFFLLINKHDVFRKESFQDVFPEFWQHLSKYQPNGLENGSYSERDQLQMDFIKNPSKYPAFYKMQSFRMDWTILKDSEKFEAKETLEVVAACLHEINQFFDKSDSVANKIEELTQYFKDRQNSTLSFLNDFFVFGPFKFYKALSDLDLKELPEILKRKYPSESIHKVS